MNSTEFLIRSNEMAEAIVQYLQNVPNRRVNPNVQPGYLLPHLPETAPAESEDWSLIMADLDNYILPGITHWQHPQFHAYFPAGNSYPSILGEMMSSAFGAVGFSWVSCPAFTELEVIMVNWVGKMLGLSEKFLFSSNNEGGGVIQGSASECVLVCLLAARHKKLKQLRKQYPDTEDGVLLSKLVAYTSQEAHSCVQKAAMIGFVKLRRLDTDERYRLRGDNLEKAIKKDKERGLVPFFVSATLGTTSCCSFDDLTELGPICEEEDIWLHVDAAYAGNALICPEFRHLSRGLDYAQSFNVNLHKWLMVNFDCSLMWVKNKMQLTEPLIVDPLYLQHNQSDKAVDYRNWTIPLSRRFRSLKLWFVLRKYGVKELQNHIREHVRLAKELEGLIRQDSRFQIMNEVQTGLVCFRLKGTNNLTETLLHFLNKSGRFFAVPASLKGKYVIRISMNGAALTNKDILDSWNIISQMTTVLFQIGKSCFQKQVDFGQDKENIKQSRKPILARSFSECKTSLINSGKLKMRRLTDIADNEKEYITLR